MKNSENPKVAHLVPDAKQISKLILNTPTEERGDLFILIADELSHYYGQNYTAHLFKTIGVEYGGILGKEEDEI